MACLVKILRNFHEWGFALAYWSDGIAILPAVRSCKEAIPKGIARKSPRMSPIFDLESADGELQ